MCKASISNTSVASLPMFPRLMTSLRSSPPYLALCWAATGVSVVSFSACLALYLADQPVPVGLVVLQAVAAVIAVVQLRAGARSISLRPAELAERLLKVQEEERQHLGRELHDDIGQLLTAAKLQLQWLQRRMPEDAQGHCQALHATLDDALRNVRDVSALLNPRQLASLGLEASLRAHLLRTLDGSGVQWSLACRQRLGGIEEPVAMAVFRITQEAVTNMLRHAQARNLVVRLQRTELGLALSIEDDGCGFKPARHPHRANQRGLAGMLERVTALNGSLQITSDVGQGTRIEALFPWPPGTRQRADRVDTHDL